MAVLKSESTAVTQANNDQFSAREELWHLFKTCSIPEAEKERNLGLFLRSASLSRFLALSEIYKRIIDLPGSILDLGTWRGQNLIICENLRAIYEPHNKQRRVIGFDTFTGYHSDKRESVNHTSFNQGTYSTETEYSHFLESLLQTHVRINSLGHVPSGHRVIKGDVSKTVPQFLNEEKNLLVALAFFDLNLEQPTSEALMSIISRIPPGGLVVFFQLQRDFLPGEGLTYSQQILGKRRHKLERSMVYPSISIVTMLD